MHMEGKPNLTFLKSHTTMSQGSRWNKRIHSGKQIPATSGTLSLGSAGTPKLTPVYLPE